MNNLRRMYKRLKRNRTYALRNLDEFLAAASLYHFRKISSLPEVYRTGIREIDDANTAKLQCYKVYEPAVQKPISAKDLGNRFSLNVSTVTDGDGLVNK